MSALLEFMLLPGAILHLVAIALAVVGFVVECRSTVRGWQR